MAVTISTKHVEVPVGYLAYLGGDGYVWGAPRRGVRGAKRKLGSEKIDRKPGFMYFVKNGAVMAVKR